MKILIIGKTGQLAKTFQSILQENRHKYSDEYIFVPREAIDLNNTKSIKLFFMNNITDVIVNFAAYTNVNQCELERSIANQVNHKSVEFLAKLALENNIKFIHISTDYVFDGQKKTPYNELDTTNPINYYGLSKLLGENSILQTMAKNALIIRTSWLYSRFGKNFLKSIIQRTQTQKELKVVDDQIGSPTNAIDLSLLILKIINDKAFRLDDFPTEIFHFSNTGDASWFDFAEEILSILKIQCNIVKVQSSVIKLGVMRPSYSVLDSEKISDRFDFINHDWNVSLKDFLTADDRLN